MELAEIVQEAASVAVVFVAVFVVPASAWTVNNDMHTAVIVEINDFFMASPFPFILADDKRKSTMSTLE